MKIMTVASILGLMLAAPALANVKSGVDAWDRGDYPAAVKEWRPLAVSGDADAAFNLAQAYKLGRGVPVDLKLAQDWYQKAADKGHLRAEDNLGLVMFQNGDRQRSLPYIQRSSDRGEPRAQYVLGTALFNGDMVKKDWVKAYALMTRASAAGIAPASASLAQMDRYIPLEQRQKGLVMAREYELTASRPMLAEAPSSPIHPARATPPPIRTQEVPPSEQVEAPRPVAKPPVIAAPRPVPKPAPKPVATAAKPAAVSGPAGWRVQLGAFGDPGNARALWNSLERRVSGLSGLQPYLVKAGAITRLQAGPFASKAAAEKACGAVKAAGQGCLAVAP
jgi:uncharacterized protein